MTKAARAIIIEGDKILVMQRKKTGPEYYTLVGGRMNDNETPGQAVTREVKEETGLQVTAARLVFTEDHPEPYNSQYIFLCEVAPHEEIKIQDSSEEGLMNRIGLNIHTPLWVPIKAFEKLPFNTMQLQKAILDGLSRGFPETPIKL